jgi:hypothetical protein
MRPGNHHLTARPSAVRLHQQSGGQPQTWFRGLWIRWITERPIKPALLRRVVALKAVRGDNAREAENDHNERSETPPMLVERVQAVAALESDTKYAKQHESRAQN